MIANPPTITAPLFFHASRRTRLKPAILDAARKVLVNGMSQGEAARLTKQPRQNVYRAVRRILAVLSTAEVCPVCGNRTPKPD